MTLSQTQQTPQALVRRSTNVVQVTQLRDKSTGTYLDETADVVATLLLAGVPVAGANAINLDHVAGTSGPQSMWQGMIVDSVDLSQAAYVLRVTATTVGGSVREFNIPLTARDG
jgi:hypothetical protein